jgi:hypothetical protein
MRYLVLAHAFPVEDWACSAAAAGKLQDREPCCRSSRRLKNDQSNPHAGIDPLDHS